MIARAALPWGVCAALLCGTAIAAERLQLADPGLAGDAAARERLSYLAGCALREGTTLETNVDGQHYEFAGILGLAPEWTKRPLTPEESRWVSACILARTNYFGVRVQISMRATPPPVAGLDTDAAERERYTLDEGGFFGNIFEREARAYACVGDGPARTTQALRGHKRICSVPDGGKLEGRPLSACGFIIVGRCADRPFVQNGVDYSDQVIRVYLDPK